MPDATISQETHHHDLKSLEGAWVELRQLPYYEMLVRRDKATSMSMESEVGKRKRGEPQTTKMTVDTLQTWERDYTFKNCIANHNLTDKQGTPLDFSNPITLRSLRPDVGLEIEKLIDDLNNEGDEFEEDFPPAPSSSLKEKQTQPPTPSE